MRENNRKKISLKTAYHKIIQKALLFVSVIPSALTLKHPPLKDYFFLISTLSYRIECMKERLIPLN